MQGRGKTMKVVTLALVLALSAGVGVAWAQAPAPGSTVPCERRGPFLTPEDREAMGAILMNRLKERIGLMDAQAEDVRATLRARRDTMRADAQALCLARRDLHALVAGADADPAAVRAAGDRVKAAQAQLLDHRLDAYLELRGKLNADQWAKWVELRKEMRHRGRWGGRPFAM